MVSQLPPPVLLLGDFNAHNSVWGCVDTNAKCLELATFLLQSNLCPLNTTDITYIHPSTGSHSSIDLAICDPALFLDISWNVNDDLCESDHFPVILSTCRRLLWEAHKDGICRKLSRTPTNFCVKIDSAMKK